MQMQQPGPNLNPPTSAKPIISDPIITNANDNSHPTTTLFTAEPPPRDPITATTTTTTTPPPPNHPSCPRCFHLVDDLLRHNEGHARYDNGSKFRCDVCQLAFSKHRSLSNHCTKVHLIPPKHIPPSLVRFTLDYCFDVGAGSGLRDRNLFRVGGESGPGPINLISPPFSPPLGTITTPSSKDRISTHSPRHTTTTSTTTTSNHSSKGQLLPQINIFIVDNDDIETSSNNGHNQYLDDPLHLVSGILNRNVIRDDDKGQGQQSNSKNNAGNEKIHFQKKDQFSLSGDNKLRDSDHLMDCHQPYGVENIDSNVLDSFINGVLGGNIIIGMKRKGVVVGGDGDDFDQNGHNDFENGHNDQPKVTTETKAPRRRRLIRKGDAKNTEVGGDDNFDNDNDTTMQDKRTLPPILNSPPTTRHGQNSLQLVESQTETKRRATRQLLIMGSPSSKVQTKQPKSRPSQGNGSTIGKATKDEKISLRSQFSDDDGW